MNQSNQNQPNPSKPTSEGAEGSESKMASSSVITPEEVLESLMNDGTIDALRLKIINQLKANEELKNTTIKMVEQSKVLNTPGAEKQTKRELFDSLRQELEAPALEKASKSVWDLILDNNGLGKEISETVEKVFCRLSGKEPPLFPPPIDGNPPDEETEIEKGKGNPPNEETERKKGKGDPSNEETEREKGKGNPSNEETKREKGKGKEKETKIKKENSSSKLKKRSFSKMSAGTTHEVASKSSDTSAALDDYK